MFYLRQPAYSSSSYHLVRGDEVVGREFGIKLFINGCCEEHVSQTLGPIKRRYKPLIVEQLSSQIIKKVSEYYRKDV